MTAHGTAEPPPLSVRELAALGISVALVPLNSTMIAVAVPTIAHDLSRPAGALTQALVASYLLVGIVLQSPGGKLGDGIGHTRALRLGQVVFALGALTGFLGRAMVPLAIARGLMAAGGAVMVPSAFALVRSRVPSHGQAKAFGAFAALMGVAAGIGPLIGGEIAGRFGWPALFVVNAPAVLLAAILARSKAPEPRRPMPRFDLVGSALLGIGLLLTVLGMRAHEWIVAAGGALVVVAFFMWERRAANPVIDPSLFRIRAFAAGVSVIGMQNLAMYALLFEVPEVLSRAFNADTATRAHVLLWLTGAMVSGSLGGGRIVGVIGARWCAIVGAVVAVAGMVVLAVSVPAASIDLAPGLVALGVGIGLTTPAVQTLALGSIDRARSGMAAGVSSTARYLGGVIGVGVVSTLIGSSDDAHVLAAHQHATEILVGALVLAVVAAVALPVRRGSDAGNVSKPVASATDRIANRPDARLARPYTNGRFRDAWRQGVQQDEGDRP